MKFQTIASFALLVAMASNTQGLLIKSLIKKAIPSIVPSVGSLSGIIGTDSTLQPLPIVEETPVRLVSSVKVVPAPAPVYTYAPVYTAPVYYYRAVRPVRRGVYLRADLGGLKSGLTGLIAGSARTLGDIGSGIKGAVGNALSSVGPTTAGVYYSSF